MFAPPVAAASSDIHQPCLSAFEQPTEKTLVPESTQSQLVFPNEFPYEFDFTSPEDLTETEDETNEDEDEFLAGLTRRLALFTQRSLVTDKAKVNSTESTRSGLGSCTTSENKSPNGPFSQAPSQQASLKVDAKSNRRPNPKPNSFTPFPQNAAFCNYYYYWWLRQPQFAMVAYPYPVIGVLASPTAVTQHSTGTGVFLPQDYSNPSASLRNRGGGCVKLPTKVVQTQHSKTEKLPGRWQSRLSAGRGKLGRGTNKSAVTGGSFKV
ncbi:unnamed protein product [Eruca vesicaria subsp. sativa]|uniref:Uncharacterized protein n=1 Tax=Eruca vesicaria subsp. sativa TaxID=29727 RepID=A0ABC8LM77_ERUVS|nr:unnamed protein product [Eruca vesicaria subsp. sativa]